MVEEAHSLLIDQMSGQPTTFARLYESALAELRAAGIGFATVDQRYEKVPYISDHYPIAAVLEFK